MYAVAKAITRFLFGEAQPPVCLLHCASFFAGLATGAVGASTLYAYFNRSKCDRAKVQLAVYHIIRLFRHRPDYAALLQDPQELLRRMEPEVVRMVDKHLTQNEADIVVKELKRNYANIAGEGYTHKRVRENKCDVAKERMGPCLAPACVPSPRGFLPPSGTDQPNIDAITSTGICSLQTRRRFVMGLSGTVV